MLVTTPKKPAKRARRPSPSPELDAPISAVVLGVDPGARSGWAILAPAGKLEAGEVRTKIDAPIARALEVAAANELPLIVAMEKWTAGGWKSFASFGGLSAQAARWLEALRVAGVPKKSVVRVTTQRWRARVIGGRQRPTEAWKAAAIAAMRTRYEGIELGPDAAEAACIATWATRAGEVAKAMPKRAAR